jgi:hypothetical protein
MKYLAITLLFVISLTNSEIYLEFKQLRYTFKNIDINLNKDNPYHFSIFKGESIQPEVHFSRKILEDRLKHELCAHSKDEHRGKTYKDGFGR